LIDKFTFALDFYSRHELHVLAMNYSSSDRDKIVNEKKKKREKKKKKKLRYVRDLRSRDITHHDIITKSVKRAEVKRPK